jgi:single-strand DNA-binding protein
VVPWRQLAEVCADHLVKGQRVAVTGSLRLRSYEGRDGQRGEGYEIQAGNVEFLVKPKGARASADGSGGDPAPGPPGRDAALWDDESVPF